MFSAKVQPTLLFSVSLAALMIHGELSHADRGPSTVPEPGSCMAFNYNGDRLTDSHDVTPMLQIHDSDLESVQIIERSFASGCAAQLFSYPWAEALSGEPVGEVMLQHYESCLAVDHDANGSLDLADVQLILADQSYSVRDRVDAIRRIGNEQISYEGQYEDTENTFTLNLQCRNVDLEGALLQTPGLYEDLMNRLSQCFEADLNEDNVIDVADLALVINRDTDLTVEQRIVYARAIQSPMCSGVLENI